MARIAPSSRSSRSPPTLATDRAGNSDSPGSPRTYARRRRPARFGVSSPGGVRLAHPNAASDSAIEIDDVVGTRASVRHAPDGLSVDPTDAQAIVTCPRQQVQRP